MAACSYPVTAVSEANRAARLGRFPGSCAPAGESAPAPSSNPAARNLVGNREEADGFLTRSLLRSTSGVGPGGSRFSAGRPAVAGIEVVDVQGGAKSSVGLTHYSPDDLQSFGEAPGKGKLDR